MTDAAIVAEGIGKRFGPVLALDGVDLVLPAGGVLGLLGPNGAGKTTLVRILATLLRPDRGRARVAGFDVAEQPQAVRRLIGLLGLTSAAGRLVRSYSGGMRRRLDVAASLLAAPPVLFLDEPTTGLDPRGRLALWRVLGELTARGTSVLLTTQYIEEAERLAGTVVIIDHGTVIASGTPGQLQAQAGGDRLDLQSPPGQDPRQLAAALSALGTAEPAIDEAAGRVVLPVTGGPGILPEVAGRLAAAGLHVSGLALRRPTLEEAFLALTGPPPSRTRPPPHDATGPPAATARPAHRTRSAP